MNPASTRHLNEKRVRAIIDVIAQGDEAGQYEIFRRLGLAASFLISRSRLAGPTFDGFKQSLTPADAEAAAKRARLIAIGVGRAESPLDEMAFMLVAASLFERAGTTWVAADMAELIDSMIRAGETLIGSEPEAMAPPVAPPAAKGSSRE